MSADMRVAQAVSSADMRVAQAVVSWLDGLLARRLDGLQEDSSESLEVCKMCLVEHFGLDAYEGPPVSLVVEECNGDDTGVADDANFKEFVAAAQAKGFFEHCDDTEYRQRYQKVVDRFLLTRQPTTKTAATAASPAAAMNHIDEVRHAVDVLGACLGDAANTRSAAHAILANQTIVESLLTSPDTRNLAADALRHHRGASSSSQRHVMR